MNRHLLCTAALLTLPFAASPALACSVSALSVTCSGVSSGFEDDTDGLSILVESGATVQDNGDTLKGEGNGVTITNDGTVISDSKDAIDWGDIDNGTGTDLSITNNGKLTAAKDGINAADDFHIENFGTIEAGDDGIQAGNGKGSGTIGILNGASGLIDTEDKAITVGDGVWLFNEGTIDSGNEAFEAGNDARVTNKGTITAFEDGVQVGTGARIDNYGAIVSTGNDGDGIDIDDGTIINYAGASITVAGSAGIDYDAGGDSSVENYGLIEGVEGIMVETGLDAAGNPNGEVGNVAVQKILNAGTIRGTGGTALLLGEGNDVLELLDGAIVDGLSDLGDDDDSLIFSSLSYGTDGFDSLFDGGEGTDTVSFTFDISNLATATLDAGILTLAFGDAVGLGDLDLTNFEVFDFAGTAYTINDLVPAVPLPAGAILLGTALAGFGAVRRRR
ncbi:VPLPA-CTERM sorting domain-containing protein [Tropicimonas sp. IMCC34043]|uniref:VPLPA-CTERM sorting domain-containing protein n=1 Tax=Tropicimonas sp. IMCC34043 TaxID=2248760 RepID=UPI000E22B918|nr:VPLPA-CTERM sorting domain-containing protein [Tropicimonas sp. IMCC34043]